MSFYNVAKGQTSCWKNFEKALLRFFFVYFILQIIPLDIQFYKQLFSQNWLNPSFYGLFSLSRYTPRFLPDAGFANWALIALVAAVLSFIWAKFDREDRNYDTLLYWLRVILRYRLALGVIAYGLIKLFPLQMPYPSLSNLYTNYGQIEPWKIYFHTIGIVPWYESFLGAVEIIAGLLLFFRRTTTFGAGIILGFLGNVLFANSSYSIGEQMYCAYLLSIAVFLFAYDVPRLYSLLLLEKETIADRFVPVFSERGLQRLRTGLRTAFSLFVLFLGYKTYQTYETEPYNIPQTAGIKGSYGYYNVSTFKLNNKEIPYTRTNPDRWQNVVFEKWATVSIKTAKPVVIDESKGGLFSDDDVKGDYESAGIGDRRYFSYKTDTATRSLVLENKNQNHASEKFYLTYTQANDSTIVVKGVNERKDSIYAVLNRIEKPQMLFVGRRKPIKL